MSRLHDTQHKMVFDAAEVGGGAVFSNAASYLTGMRLDAGTQASILPVLVIRHAGIVMAFNDVAWDRYGIGKRMKLKDPVGGDDARRNPFLSRLPGQKGGPLEADETIEALQHQAIFLACDTALGSFAGFFARDAGSTADKVADDLRANLVPGTILQPTGILAVARAQRAGCSYLRSS